MFSTTKIFAAHRPYHAPELTTFSATGAYNYSVPFWCDRVDIILIGGGKGGSQGLFGGVGGQAAAWLSITMVRGAGIPWTTTSITGTVGLGGTSNSGNGGNTTATATGMTTQTATGQTALQGSGVAGQSRSNLVFNSQTYTGGTGGASAGQAGTAPGAGGAGGGGLGGASGAGGAGRAFFFAYQNGTV